jgi:hypothetical protein
LVSPLPCLAHEVDVDSPFEKCFREGDDCCCFVVSALDGRHSHGCRHDIDELFGLIEFKHSFDGVFLGVECQKSEFGLVVVVEDSGECHLFKRG